MGFTTKATIDVGGDIVTKHWWFDDYEDFKEWLESQTDERQKIYTPHETELTKGDAWIVPVSFPSDGNKVQIHYIYTEEGCIFSDGKYTADKKHCSKKFKEFCQSMWKEIQAEDYHFIED